MSSFPKPSSHVPNFAILQWCVDKEIWVLSDHVATSSFILLTFIQMSVSKNLIFVLKKKNQELLPQWPTLRLVKNVSMFLPFQKWFSFVLILVGRSP